MQGRYQAQLSFQPTVIECAEEYEGREKMWEGCLHLLEVGQEVDALDIAAANSKSFLLARRGGALHQMI